MANPTRLELRRNVQRRLRDFDGTKWHPTEIDILLNEHQDEFSRDTEYLIVPIVQDAIAAVTDSNSNVITTVPYIIEPNLGYELLRIAELQFYDGSVYVHVPVWTVEQLESNDPNYRTRQSSRPTCYVRNFDPSGGRTSPANDSVWLYPNLDTTYSNGLVARCKVCTKKQMNTDSTPMALPARIAEEAIVARTVAYCLMRGPRFGKLQINPSDLINYGLQRFEKDKINACREVASGFDRAKGRTKVYWK